MTTDGRSLGADFTRLWAAFSISEVGSAVGAGALPVVAVLALGVADWQVSLMAAVGAFASAVVALPLGPWIEHRRKRPVMIAADALRAAALLSVPLAAWSGRLSYAQLCVVSVLASTGLIAFGAASGAHLKGLVGPDGLAQANSRFESVRWTAATIGPPIGGVLMSVLGATVTLVIDGLSFLGSALAIRRLRTPEPTPPAPEADERRWLRLTAGWRYLWTHPGLRPLFCNAMLFGGALLWASPLTTVLMLRQLGFAPWQYGLALGLPCLGGVLGSALAPRLLSHHGERRVLLASGVSRTLWLAPVALAPAGAAGLVVIVVADFLLLFSAGVFNPTFTTYRLRETADSHMARTGAAWSISAKAVQPMFMLAGGAVAAATDVRTALGVAAVLLLLTVPLLPWRAR